MTTRKRPYEPCPSVTPSMLVADRMFDLLDEIRCRHRVYSAQGDFEIDDMIFDIEAVIADAKGLNRPAARQQ